MSELPEELYPETVKVLYAISINENDFMRYPNLPSSFTLTPCRVLVELFSEIRESIGQDVGEEGELHLKRKCLLMTKSALVLMKDVLFPHPTPLP